jgi:mercuric ion transport protein
MTGLAGAACAACCVLPALLAAGILGGAGWAAANRFMPGVAIALAALAGLSWWWASKRRHTTSCADGGCSCGQGDQKDRQVVKIGSDA